MAHEAAPTERIARIAVAALLAAGCAALIFAARHVAPGETLLSHYDALANFIAAHRALAIASFAMLYIAIIALCLPGNVIMALLAGILFGGFTGGTIAVLSATLGGTLFFLAIRAGFAALLARRAPPRIATIAEGFRKDGFFYLLFLRLTPLFPFFIVNFAAAICGLRLPIFVAATLIGIAPVTFSYAFAAAGLEQFVAQQAQAFLACKAAGQNCAPLPLTDLARADFLLPLSMLGALSILPVLVRRFAPRLRKAG